MEKKKKAETKFQTRLKAVCIHCQMTVLADKHRNCPMTGCSLPNKSIDFWGKVGTIEVVVISGQAPE
jgi:hypothetical protein